MSRDSLRSKTVGSQKLRFRQTVEFDGDDYLIMSPTVRGRADVIANANTGDEDMELDSALFQCLALIECVYDPDSERRVFEPGDLASLLDQPVGGFVDILGTPALKALRSSVNDGVEQAEKNSSTTENSKPDASSESSSENPSEK